MYWNVCSDKMADMVNSLEATAKALEEYRAKSCWRQWEGAERSQTEHVVDVGSTAEITGVASSAIFAADCDFPFVELYGDQASKFDMEAFEEVASIFAVDEQVPQIANTARIFNLGEARASRKRENNLVP